MFIKKVCADNLVFPTHVGVFPYGIAPLYVEDRLPHARGGVSEPHGQPKESSWSSPRTWGCFMIGGVSRARVSVFPTHVGVFPELKSLATPERAVFPTHVGVFPR